MVLWRLVSMVLCVGLAFFIAGSGGAFNSWSTFAIFSLLLIVAVFLAFLEGLYSPEEIYAKIQKVDGHGMWENVFMDTLRKKHCLCFNCAKMKPGEPDHCPIAQAGFELCEKYGVSFAMTRCPEWKEKPKSV